MDNKKIIVANWKMNPQTEEEVLLFFKTFKKYVENIPNAEIVICPPIIFLPCIKDQKINAKLGAQDMFWEEKGAYTGVISPLMIKNFGCQYVILGHSERRKYLGETDEMINLKLKAAIKNRISPIVCIGEFSSGESEDSYKFLEREIKGAFRGVENFASLPFPVIIAYEPVWAIGTGMTPNANKVLGMLLFIKKIIGEIYGEKAAEKIKIIYGGSVDSKNAREFIKEGKMDGLLVGGASLYAIEFAKIAQEAVR